MRTVVPTVLAVILGCALLVLFVSWAFTVSTDEWTEIDDKCWVHETKYEGTWPFNSDGELHRAVYCEKEYQ